jgi:hypothetical protein
MPIFKPRFILHLEGAVVLVLACVVYQRLHGSWVWFGLLILTPDVSMVGYLVNSVVGAVCYNIGHTYVGPLILLAVFWGLGNSIGYLFCLIWIAHIGMDRMLGYGLKYPSGFGENHLRRV